ncbi:GntR family transcriptional regulator [Streptomyces sp. NPDC005336]|uniref:GntR family transcriptional regulator n=1 Tax=Streptomyces sp. NPDC005336 TaxID=3157035 RepID=UPI0033A3FE89
MADHPRDSLTVTDAERAALTRWVHGSNTPQALAQRARIVLACEQHPTVTEAARSLGLPRAMVSRWRSRFLDAGLDGLRDHTRPGRPKTVTTEDGARLVVATMLTPPPSAETWSTRSLAAATGLSQSTVSRVCHSLWPRRAASIPAATEPFRHLAGVYIDPAVRVLAACPGGEPPSPVRADVPGRRSKLARNCVQSTLAAATAVSMPQQPDSADVSKQHAASGNGSGLFQFLTALDRAVPAGHTIVLITRDAGIPDPVTERWLHRRARFRVVRTATESDWQAHVEQIFASPSLEPADITGLRSQLHAWAHRTEPPFTWIRPWTLINESVHASDTSQATGGQRLADQVAHALREAIADGQFQPGERIKESPLAERVGTSRGPVREALRVLAEEGLVELVPNRGAVVPQVRGTDALETYAARVSLGALLLRRLATLESAALSPLAAALADLRTAIRRGDVYAAGDADMRFQEAMADAAGLPRTAVHFNRLAMQLLIFVAILGLDYAYPPERIVRDNTAILEALRNRSPEEAARLWRAKMEHCVRYLIAQLPTEDFDQGLWLTISGPATPQDLKQTPDAARL